MPVHVDAGEDGLEASGCVDDEGLAFGADQAADDRQAAQDRPVGFVGPFDRPILVAKQAERQVEFLAERLMGSLPVPADAQHHRPCLLQ